MGYVPMYAEEAFLILEPYLPPGTRMTSAYRSPQDQLATIRNLVRQHNLRHKRDRISLSADMQPNRPETWLPSLRELRARQYKVNAPVAGHGIPLSPHTTYNIVFDLSGAELDRIEVGCRTAQRLGLIGFRQILKEPNNNAVHLHVNWISSWALEKLYSTFGFATA